MTFFRRVQQAKVVSIVGNTGEGKSYCLNRLFFADYDDTDDVISGEGVFSTSPYQDSCTLGVWAAYDPTREVIVLDTEGMLGQTGKKITWLCVVINSRVFIYTVYLSFVEQNVRFSNFKI